ncbi:MAG: hypothetical protein ACRD09_05030 [Vicinamibacterales bacterium]
MRLPAERSPRRALFPAAVCTLAIAATLLAPLRADNSPIQGPELEAFLRRAEISEMRAIPIGVTKPRRVTLTFDGVRRDAAWRVIDDSRTGATNLGGKREMDFEDTWRTDCAAYELDKLLGLGMIPATVERVISGERGSLTLWVENALTEKERRERNILPPDPEAWSRQVFKMRMFDNLIHNIDRNLGNSLITDDWQLRLIDHSRSFRKATSLREPDQLARFSRSMLDAMARLERRTLREHLGRYITVFQIDALLERRDRLLALATKVATERGDVVYYP